MARPGWLTRGDVRFLAGVRRDPLSLLEEIEELTGELQAAEEARGVGADWSAIGDVEDAVDDPQRLDEIRAALRSQLGRVQRGEVAPAAPVDERGAWNREFLEELREAREAVEGASPTDEESTDELA